MDVEQVKFAATNRWREIIARVGGVDEEHLDGKHHPCPKCGGVDRFRLIDVSAGAVLCNQCFARNNGDGIAAVMWLRGCDFPTALSMISDYLGMSNGKDEPQSMVEEMARRKHMPLESFKAFGAKEALRGMVRVARVPMYDEFGKHCSDFDLASVSEAFEKGLSAKGLPVGVFLHAVPEPGQDVIVTEGVKDAAALHRLGFTVIGLPTCELDVKFVRLLADCKVTIVPDRDTAGERGAEVSASRLAGVAASVRIAVLPTEFRDSGGDGVREVLAKADGERLLRQAIQDAKPWMTAVVSVPETMVQACHAYIDCLERGEATTLSCGIPAIDEAIGGVAFGEMVVIGARPSHGKTMFALQWLDLAAALGHAGLIVSEEMSSMALASRSLSYVSDTPTAHWRDQIGVLRADVNDHYAERADVYIAEHCGTTAEAERRIERAAKERNIRIVAVDYAQLLRNVGSSRYEQVTNTSVTLKQCAVKFNIILLLLCQLSREIEKRPDRTPKLSDLRESGQIEQDADVVLFLQWPLKDDSRYKPYNEYRIYVAKNRNRETTQSIIITKFNPSRQRIERREAEDMENYEPSFDPWK